VASRAVVFDLIARSQQFEKGFDRAGKKASGFGKVMGRVSAGLAGAFAGGAVIAGVRKVANAGSDLNETVNKTGLAFGRNAGQIQKWAQGSAKSMGLPKQAALEGASSFGLLFSKIGVGAGQSAKMSQAMVQLAVDLGSVHNADPTAIIEAQTAAFRGEYDSLQRFVPAINAAVVEHEAMAATGKKSAKALTDGEKAAAVYAIMLRQTKKEQGDFARTADESANKTKINAARLADLSANVGTILLPALTAAGNALGGMADWVEKNKRAATLLGGAIVALAGFVLAMNAATKVTFAVQKAVRGVTLAWAAAQWVLNTALTANPIGLVVVAIGLLVAGLILAYKNSATFRRVVGQAFDFVRDKVGRVVSFIVSAVRGWLNVQLAVVAGILRVMGKLPGPMGAPFRKAEEAVRKAKETVNRQLDVIQRRVDKLTGKDIPITASLKLNFSKSFTAKDWVSVRAAAGRMAQGGKVPGGFGGGDRVPILAEPGEAVVDKTRTRRYASWLAAMGVPGFAAGGVVGKIDTETRAINRVQAGGTGRRMDVGITKLLSAFNARPPHIPGGWQVAVNLLRRLGIAFNVISTFRPGARTRASGSVSYHALNRAVDLAGPNMLRIFNALTRTNPTELIYSGASRYKSRRGWSPIGRLDPITLADHWSHVHAAYKRGGLIPEDVFGRGRSGRTYSFHGGETVTPKGGRFTREDARMIAEELAKVIPTTISVDNVHTGLLAKKRGQGRIKLGLE
jgi:hypothetical protein